jgi:anti-sigma regulatory factor (Ser/Thr protein kinase)
VLRDQLSAWGAADEDALVELAVSELVTNAVLHGRDRIEVRMSLDDTRVRLDVTDEGPRPATAPLLADSALGGEGGRGLRILRDLSDAWGMERHPDRTHVWMERRADGALRSAAG